MIRNSKKKGVSKAFKRKPWQSVRKSLKTRIVAEGKSTSKLENFCDKELHNYQNWATLRKAW